MATFAPLLSFEDLPVGGTIGRVFKIVTSNVLTFLSLAATAVIPVLVVMFAGTFTFYTALTKALKEMDKDGGGVTPDDNNDKQWEDYQTVIIESFVGLGLIVLLSVILSVVVTIVGQAAMVRATAELYAFNRMPDASVALQKGLWQFCELFLAGILMQILNLFVLSLPILATVHGMVFLGLFLSLVVPFIAMYLSIRFALVNPAIVCEESCTASGGLKRSWQLTEGAFCDIWCAKTCFGALYCAVVSVGIAVLVKSSALGNEKATLALFLLTVSLPNFFFTCSAAVLQTVLYINRRVRTEGLTQDVLVQDLVDRRRTAEMTQPLLTVTEVHAEMDDGTPIVPVEGGEAPKIDIVPEAEQV